MKISSLMTTFGALILISGTLASKNIPTKFNFLSAVKSRSDIVVRRQDTAECTPDSEEYDRRLKAVAITTQKKILTRAIQIVIL